MKLLMIAMLLVPGLVMADGKVMPNGQKCADGWICVPPGKPKAHKKVAKKPAPKPVVACEPKTVRVEVVKETRVVQKNHFRLLGGIGPTGIGQSGVNPVIFTRNYMETFGAAYGRNISERFSLEAEALTNGTGLVGIGYNW